MKLNFLALLAGLLGCFGSSAADQTRVVVDVRAGTVDGIDMRQSGALLQKKLGTRVIKTTEQLEGEPSDLFVVTFDGHEIYKHWNAFSFKDSAFRTKEDLGVGSTVADFDRAYSPSTFSGEEGCHWLLAGKGIYLALDSDCSQNRKQTVKEIWVW